MRKTKPKFDKKMCLRCVYSTTQISGAYIVTCGRNPTRVACNYSTATGKSCLTKTNEGVCDLRGEDYNKCKLFRGKVNGDR